MQIEVYKKLWVNCHLMYPNSSQARDVFSHLVTVSKKENLDTQAFLKTTFQTLTNVKSVKSGSNYFEYSEYTLDCWNLVLNKCQRREQFFLMSVLYNKVSFKDLEKATEISENKIKYLINQALKKISDFAKEDHKVLSNDIQFKAHHEKKISKISLSEQIFEALLNYIPEKDKAFILSEAAKYPDTQKIIDTVKKLQQELDGIPKSETFLENIAAIEKSFENSEKEKKLNNKISFLLQKKTNLYLASAALLVFCFYAAFNFRNDNSQIVLETIQIQRQQPKQALAVVKDIEISDSKSQLASAFAVSRIIAKSTSAAVVVKKPAVKLVAMNVVSAPIITQTMSPEEMNLKRKNTGVYRGIVEVTDLIEVTERVKSKILSLGGFKAGEVELGWMKSADTTYFHFIIPSENTEDLNQFIRQFGDYKSRFEKHPRVLDSEQKRFIIEVRKVE